MGHGGMSIQFITGFHPAKTQDEVIVLVCFSDEPIGPAGPAKNQQVACTIAMSSRMAEALASQLKLLVSTPPTSSS